MRPHTIITFAKSCTFHQAEGKLIISVTFLIIMMLCFGVLEVDVLKGYSYNPGANNRLRS